MTDQCAMGFNSISALQKVKVVPLDQPAANEIRRTGFMTGRISVPDDFDRMGSEEIERLFGVGG